MAKESINFIQLYNMFYSVDRRLVEYFKDNNIGKDIEILKLNFCGVNHGENKGAYSWSEYLISKKDFNKSAENPVLMSLFTSLKINNIHHEFDGFSNKVLNLEDIKNNYYIIKNANCNDYHYEAFFNLKEEPEVLYSNDMLEYLNKSAKSLGIKENEKYFIYKYPVEHKQDPIWEYIYQEDSKINEKVETNMDEKFRLEMKKKKDEILDEYGKLIKSLYKIAEECNCPIDYPVFLGFEEYTFIDESDIIDDIIKNNNQLKGELLSLKARINEIKNDLKILDNNINNYFDVIEIR